MSCENVTLRTQAKEQRKTRERIYFRKHKSRTSVTEKSSSLNARSQIIWKKMVNNTFSLIVAACENYGIGFKGNLPWQLKCVKFPLISHFISSKQTIQFTQLFIIAISLALSEYRNELKYFNRMTTTTNDSAKRNAVIMGRLTYYGIPESKRPLPNRLNIVLSSKSVASDYPADVVLCTSLDDAMHKLVNTELGADIESIWICGGYSVYKEAMTSTYCNRIYFTEVKAKFECDAFFPTIPATFQQVANDENVPSGEQEENGLKYEYKIFEKTE